MIKKLMSLSLLLCLQTSNVVFAESLSEYCSANYKLNGTIPEDWYPSAKYSTWAKAGLWSSGILLYPAIITYPMAISDTKWRRKQKADKIREKCNPYLQNLQIANNYKLQNTETLLSNNETKVAEQKINANYTFTNLICIKLEYVLDQNGHLAKPVTEIYYIDPDKQLVYSSEKEPLSGIINFTDSMIYFTSTYDSANLANDYELEYSYEINRMTGNIKVSVRTKAKSVSAKIEHGIGKMFGVTDTMFAQGTGTATKVEAKQLF